MNEPNPLYAEVSRLRAQVTDLAAGQLAHAAAAGRVADELRAVNAELVAALECIMQGAVPVKRGGVALADVADDPRKREDCLISADWFDRKIQQRRDFCETHPNSAGILAVLEELAMFQRAAVSLRLADPAAKEGMVMVPREIVNYLDGISTVFEDRFLTLTEKAPEMDRLARCARAAMLTEKQK